jgi:hypothetical protein
MTLSIPFLSLVGLDYVVYGGRVAAGSHGQLKVRVPILIAAKVANHQ